MRGSIDESKFPECNNRLRLRLSFAQHCEEFEAEPFGKGTFCCVSVGKIILLGSTVCWGTTKVCVYIVGDK